MKFDILIVEDNASMLRMLKDTLQAEGWLVDTAANGEDGIDKMSLNEYLVVVTDLKLPGKKDGMSVLYSIKAIDPSIAVIIMTAFGTIELAVTAMKEGAMDFLTKPFDTNLLIIMIKRALDQQRLRTENIVLREEFADQIGAPQILGKSPLFLKVIEEVQKVGQSDATVLLLGESGTGKELIARAIHHLSNRRHHPFVAINCAAIPENLLESELFGYEKGAFTGAERKKIGKFELADRGTILLDEIGDMSLNLQAKLLRILQEREFERVGGTKIISVNVRVVAASNQNLAKQVRNNKFRNDLYYRLSVFPITLPPLRERKDDIPLLTEHFIKKFSLELKRPGMELSRASMKKLANYHWPGNIRELQNCIERAVILASQNVIEPEDLGFSGIDTEREVNLSSLPLDGNLQEATHIAKQLVEKSMIRQALIKSGGNKLRAARALEINYKTLLSKIREYELDTALSDLLEIEDIEEL